MTDVMDDLSVMWRSAPVNPVPDAAIQPKPDVPLEVLERRICSLAGTLAASTREWLRLIAEFDARKGWTQWGIKSCSHWLSWACSVGPGAAREYVRVATALAAVPALDAAFAKGRLSYSKMRALTRLAGEVDEQVLLQQGLVHTASQLERVVRGYRKAQGTRLAQESRRQARWGWDDDGMLVLSARLPAEEGALLVAALDRSRAALDPDDKVTAADALVGVAEAALAAGDADSSGDDEHLVVLHADLAVLTDTGIDPPPDARCRIERGPGVESATAQRISCDAAVLAVLHGADPGEPLRLGRKTRRIPPALRRALRIRDERCRFPGCHRQRHLQAHHIRHWARGGSTDPDNLVLLCRRHHTAVHEGGFAVAVTPAGWEFHRPDGVPIPPSAALRGDPLRDGDIPFHHIRPQQHGERFGLAASVAALFGT